MNVSLHAEFAAFVEAEVSRGDYGTASEVIHDALRLLRREKAAGAEKMAALRREISIGLRQAAEGRLSDQSVTDLLDTLEAADNAR